MGELASGRIGEAYDVGFGSLAHVRHSATAIVRVGVGMGMGMGIVSFLNLGMSANMMDRPPSLAPTGG